MLRQQTDRIVIRTKLSAPIKLLIIFICAALFVGLIAASYYYGYAQANFNGEIARSTIDGLQKDLGSAREENQDLRTTISQAHRQLQIDKAAYGELARSLNDSNTKITELRKELKFYRSIISPSGGRSGVQIQDLVISGTASADVYGYKLVLIQALHHSEEVLGDVGFEIKGLQNDRHTTIRHPGSRDQPIRVNFKYFQNLEGLIDLPPEFSPTEIKVSVTTTGKRKKPQITERVYPWPET